MGDAIISRRGSEYTTINFNGTQAITKSGSFGLYNNAFGAAANAGPNNAYSLFGGGEYTSSGRELTVCAIDNNNVYILLETLRVARDLLAAATAGGSALFVGGRDSDGNASDVSDLYDRTLKKSSFSSGLYAPVYYLMGVSFGEHAIFAGGYDGTNRFSNVVAFSDNLYHTDLANLSDAVATAGAARNSNYAIIAGGYGVNGVVATVNAYGTDLTKATNPAQLSVARELMASGTAGDYALFVGGKISGSNVSNVAEAYDKNLTKLSVQNYEWSLREAATASLGPYLVIFGGLGGSNYYRRVDYYDSNLVRHNAPNLTNLAAYGAAASSGEYAYFFGGHFGSAYRNTVDVYHLPNKVTVYPGTKYKLGSMQNEATSSTMQTITTEAPISGYIKIKNATIS